mmetsp:Transcript_17767/g.34626  ORF Transcript_17767/g.34626 Transcript_17767/m.34626 type:complete len:202 (+) Transcript_17767:346-951(+)
MTATDAARTKWQWAMMVHEHNGLLCRLVAQPKPYDQTFSEIAPLARPVLGNLFFAMPEFLPSVFLVQHTNGLAIFCTASLVGMVGVTEPAVTQDTPRVLALLESHDVIRPRTRKPLSLLAPFSALFCVDRIPRQVPVQDLNSEGLATRRLVCRHGGQGPAIHLAFSAPGLVPSSKVSGGGVGFPVATTTFTLALVNIAECV